MISQLRGKIISLSPTELILDVNNVGYQIHISLSTFELLEHSDGERTILTHLHVREDALQLFGFATESERELFRHLISISGIGPKIAQGILSGLQAEELREAIQTGDIAALTSVSGVGRKTAERIILELKNKLGKIELTQTADTPTSAQLKNRSEALVALMSLGYNRPIAERALRNVIQESRGLELTVEELVKRALKHAISP
jgi:Holliday junction DNA helicase RuvA